MTRNRRWAWCCGGGGGVPESDPDLARWSAAEVLREAAATGAAVMLTTSALCHRSFGALDDPALPQPIRANLFRDDDAGSSWSLHWSRPRPREDRD